MFEEILRSYTTLRLPDRPATEIAAAVIALAVIVPLSLWRFDGATVLVLPAIAVVYWGIRVAIVLGRRD
ncbi:hypothetical protein [Salininema proteolyticum]|uniref:Uncharacterized protein n=1 Tax=Salininema proteolyticum TaxID=1607685 RepID=A0ABV8TZT0_9ACTN